MKRTADPVVQIVDENGGRASVPRSAFEKVWAGKGYRLVSEVEAEQQEQQRQAAESEDESAGGDSGSDAQAAVSTPPAKPAGAPATPRVGETPTGDSNQSAKPA